MTLSVGDIDNQQISSVGGFSHSSRLMQGSLLLILNMYPLYNKYYMFMK